MFLHTKSCTNVKTKPLFLFFPPCRKFTQEAVPGDIFQPTPPFIFLDYMLATCSPIPLFPKTPKGENINTPAIANASPH